MALVRLLLQAIPGHYRVFTGAGHALWTGVNPYGTDFGTGIGYYFYSPSCALFFFGPFSFLPEKIGLLLYMLLSWTVFVWGVREFTKEVKPIFPEIEGFWLMISPQIFGGILASKLEILMTGILFLCASWLLDSVKGNSKWLRSAVGFAMILNWKFQPLPTVGLLAVLWLLIQKSWKWPLTLAALVIGWFALPFAFRPTQLLLDSHSVWKQTFSVFVADSWLNFENLFSFLNNVFGIRFTLSGSQLFSLLAGLTLGCTVLLWFLKKRSLLAPEELLIKGSVLCLALGSMYSVVFSPLGQNNALILYSPLLLASFLSLSEASDKWRMIWLVTLPTVWIVMTLPYSDLIPHGLREQLRHYAFKPPVCLALAVVLALHAFKSPITPLRAAAPNRI